MESGDAFLIVALDRIINLFYSETRNKTNGNTSREFQKILNKYKINSKKHKNSKIVTLLKETAEIYEVELES